MDKTPQYGVTITKPSKAVLVLRMKEKKDRTRSVQYGYLNFQANDGKIIRTQDKSKQLGVVGPTPYVVQSMELDFTGKYSYPYTFTFCVSNMNGGKEGEGGFTVTIYLKDFNATI